MKIGQTSVIFSISKFLSYGLSFLVTVYFARVLGAEVLGTYFLVLATVTWLQLVGTAGISLAVFKRVSEGTERGEYFVAGLTLQLVALGLLVSVVYLCRAWVNQYLGVSVTEYVILILCTNVLYVFVGSTLKGEHKVHLYSVVDISKVGLQQLTQFGAVVLGLQLIGLLTGYVVGTAMATVIGLYFIAVSYQRPSRRHFVGLFSYAKYAWFSSLQSQSFSWIDTIVLGFFVTSTLIGVYEIAWNVASFLAIFGTAITQSIFPEISKESTQKNSELVNSYVRDALTYCGLLLIPGFVGGLIVGEYVLAIYGEEFRRGTNVLVILLLARLLYAYLRQFSNALNAIDRPDLAFRVNITFVVTNLTTNVVLISQFGWIGAAAATALSAAVGVIVGYRYAKSAIVFELPLEEISQQVFAAAIMGTFTVAVSIAIEGFSGRELTVPLAIAVIAGGACVYFASLIVLSKKFRTTIDRNLPFDVSVLR